MVKFMHVNSLSSSLLIDQIGIDNVLSIIPEYTVKFGLMFWICYNAVGEFDV